MTHTIKLNAKWVKSYRCILCIFSDGTIFLS